MREASEWRTRRCTLPQRQRAGWGSGKTQHSTLAENRKRRIGKTRQAEARLRRIVSQYRAPPGAERNLQMAIVQGAMLSASERASRGSTRGPSTGWAEPPLALSDPPSGLTPTRALLDHGQACFTQHQYARPRESDGPERRSWRESDRLSPHTSGRRPHCALETWQQVKTVARYVGKGAFGTERLRGQLEPEGDGVKFLS